MLRWETSGKRLGMADVVVAGRDRCSSNGRFEDFPKGEAKNLQRVFRQGGAGYGDGPTFLPNAALTRPCTAVVFKNLQVNTEEERNRTSKIQTEHERKKRGKKKAKKEGGWSGWMVSVDPSSGLPNFFWDFERLNSRLGVPLSLSFQFFLPLRVSVFLTFARCAERELPPKWTR